ncbi:hypothetical protein [Ramlibacter alkalitolerans]|uniref:Uncharacterized protein n=1 Tax=Ramlibacter alkalitolerans TaxID=2039631 RepID=A0ABS1JTV1_9BURK|nr:hypothetical protein [Ramlibacter alkalitolerans]MBL0427703.1 hypothetical protein [Ramlibacter alkalitolerans]
MPASNTLIATKSDCWAVHYDPGVDDKTELPYRAAGFRAEISAEDHSRLNGLAAAIGAHGVGQVRFEPHHLPSIKVLSTEGEYVIDFTVTEIAVDASGDVTLYEEGFNADYALDAMPEGGDGHWCNHIVIRLSDFRRPAHGPQ